MQNMHTSINLLPPSLFFLYQQCQLDIHPFSFFPFCSRSYLFFSFFPKAANLSPYTHTHNMFSIFRILPFFHIQELNRDKNGKLVVCWCPDKHDNDSLQVNCVTVKNAHERKSVQLGKVIDLAFSWINWNHSSKEVHHMVGNICPVIFSTH